ncbi:helix-turn-helix transcriptional regulator [Taibaiella koreensis]|uniref:helix-turn-helix transcriptional regulator n=1 Tax=Taibaiella koreensis TaxID=1268548 RepID=UPI000E59A2B3|nr:AraC family transcriptional regulator [Taibaiella koreensis]
MNPILTMNSQSEGTMPGPACAETDQVLQDASGYRMELHEKFFGQINLKWGSYTNPSERVLTFQPDKTTIVSHFRIADPSPVSKSRQGIAEGQFVVYPETPGPYELYISPTGEKRCRFFELGLSEAIFHHLFHEESAFLSAFSKHAPLHMPSLDFTAAMSPGMYSIIDDMYHAPFQGRLKHLFLEAKTIELFLLQIGQLDKRSQTPAVKLKKEHIACLQDIKTYLEQHFDQPASIAVLSRRAGINAMKLKSGFKQLFGTTVFGYLHSVRMREARRLLLEEGLPVHEVADKVGYQYPHHFTAAFKKQFHITPSQLRR